MKQTKFLLGACLALTLAGCSDEVGITADQLPVSGDEITFGAAAGQFTEPTKRTVYGFVDNENYSNYQKLAIKWVPGQDQVRVYCPNPSEQQWADYTVMAGTSGTASDFYLQRTNENAQGVRWGDDLDAKHEFYSFYPLKTSNGAEISGLQSDTKVRATIPTAQLSGKVTSNTDQKTGRTWYVVEPDMSYAMMVGTGTWTPGTSKNVTLNYKPIVTVLDIYVNGPADDGSEVNYTVTGVGVRSASQPIVGTFEYDLAAEAGNEFTYLTPESGSQDDNWAYVEVAGVDGNGQKLNPGEGMNVKFFLLPQDIDPSELTVYVFLSNGSVLSQPLSADQSEGSTATIAKGEIVKVLTPKVKPAETSNWMSAIGDDVLFVKRHKGVTKVVFDRLFRHLVEIFAAVYAESAQRFGQPERREKFARFGDRLFGDGEGVLPLDAPDILAVGDELVERFFRKYKSRCLKAGIYKQKSLLNRSFSV